MNNDSIPLRQQSQIYNIFSKNIETFSNLSVAIVSQKYQEFSMQVENRETLAARGLEELFFQLWFCVSFWFWQEIGFGLTYLCT
jgi:hypothetical protein